MGLKKLPQPLDPSSYIYKFRKNFNLTAKQDYFGNAPNIFVGRHDYPNINVGLLSAEDYQNNDDPTFWSKQDYQIDQIVQLRSSLINSTFKGNTKRFNDKFMDIAKEISLSIKPVDVEINLERKPVFSLNTFTEALPHGPRIMLKKAEITENPKIPSIVDKMINDELKASDALASLYDKSFDEHYLTKILSAGNLGLNPERKLVPTRWAITAVDDTLGKKLIKDVKDYPVGDYLSFFGSYLGNYYLILMFPEPWSYELFETYVGGKHGRAAWKSDHEGVYGRKDYASNTVGGYYAARLAVLERLKKLKKQGSALCLRFVTDEYHTHLGVFVVREASRNAMMSKPIRFSSYELIMKYAKNLIQKKFGFDLGQLLKESVINNDMTKQRKLENFL